ncbi:hypothetical protein [Streptomyces sp. NPDC056194]|uniref:hypothetical protein n=1 Tax=Streptomyces sp. NPDC056194 TaxID=3345744 RepID=UPI0035D83F74
MTLTHTIASETVAYGGLPSAVLHLEIDPAEHARRQAAGIGAVTGYSFGGLATLGTLPADLPVPLAALTPAQRDYVSQVPAGICTVSRGHVTRHAIKACRVTLAELTVPTLGQLAFNAADRYRQFTGSAVRIARRRPRTDDCLHRFVRAGIGVFLSNDGRTVTLARPRPCPRVTPES